MATVTRDIIGSTLSINGDFREDKATRRVFVKLASTDTGGSTRSGTAILKAIENQSDHPETACSAPLRQASAKQIGSDTFEVVLQYYHERARYLNTTRLFTMTPLVLSNKENHPAKVRVYKSPFESHDTNFSNPKFRFGLPDGANLFPNNVDVTTAEGYGRDFILPVYQLVIDGKINAGLASQLNTPLNSPGIVNSNTFTYGGITFPVNSLFFQSASIRYIDEKPNDPSGLFYEISYRFAFCPYGFRTQVVVEQPSNGVPTVETTGVAVGPPVNFYAFFPGI